MGRFALLFFLGLLVSSRAGTYGPTRRQETIAEVLSGRGFSTLLQLVERAGLAETAAEGGPFTILAPTEEAFAALDPTLRNFLLSDVEALTTTLLYHVVLGSVVGSDLEDDLELWSAAGSVLKVNVDGSSPRRIQVLVYSYFSSFIFSLTSSYLVKVILDVEICIMEARLNKDSIPFSHKNFPKEVSINGVRVQRTDLLASNGVVHVLEKVLLPPKLSIVEALAGDGRFSTLVAAISLADLFETLDSDGPFTVFAPTDDALASLPQGTVDSFLQDIPAIRQGLLRLVLPSRSYSRALLGKTFRALSGDEVNHRHGRLYNF
nr:transforming growth factor-beta-induced protein ig-h3-like [Penaeus vannamei]